MSNPAYPYNPGYPPAPQGPAPQHPYGQPAPSYPQQAPQAYAPAPPYQPQQQQQAPWMPQGPPPPAGPPAAVGTLDDFLGQPRSGGGAALKWGNKPDGYTITVQVARDVIDSDVRQQTDTRQVPQTYRDGRPKWVMVVPVIVPPGHPEHPDGKAQWYVKGDAHNALAEAMAKSGTSAKVPEGGAWVTITKTGSRNIGQGMSPATTFAVQYQPPNAGQAPAAPASAAEPQGYANGGPVPQQGPAYAPDNAQVWQQPAQPQWQPPAPQQAPQPAQQDFGQGQGWNPPGQPQWQPPAQEAPAQQPQAPAQPAPQAQGGTPPQTPEQAALIAQLTAGGAPQQQG